MRVRVKLPAQDHEPRLYLFMVVGRDLELMSIRIGEVDGVRLCVVDDRIDRDDTVVMILQPEIGQPMQEFDESVSGDTKRNPAKSAR